VYQCSTSTSCFLCSVGYDLAMQLQSNSAARQLSSAPQTHRTETLRAIAQKAHDSTARIQFLNTEAERVSQIVKSLPDDVDSRLTTLNNRLHEI